MATAAYLLSARVATGFADERLEDVALRISRTNAHHLIVIHEIDRTFVGLIKLADIAAQRDPGNRLLGDLVSKTVPIIVDAGESTSVIIDMFERHRLGEVIVTKEGTYTGLITAESILQWNRQQRDGIAEPQPLEDLPIDATERPGSASLSSRAATEKEKVQAMVLLVEDHVPSREVLRVLLTRRNLKVVEASSVREALTLFGQHAFALVISDVGLPDGSGFELMVQLRRQSNVKAISVSAFADPGFLVESKAAGFSFHFIKPLSIRTLAPAIQQLLGANSAIIEVEPNS